MAADVVGVVRHRWNFAYVRSPLAIRLRITHGYNNIVILINNIINQKTKQIKI